MADPREREEYVLNEKGRIWVGSSRRHAGRPWNFGQVGVNAGREREREREGREREREREGGREGDVSGSALPVGTLAGPGTSDRWVFMLAERERGGGREGGGRIWVCAARRHVGRPWNFGQVGVYAG